MERASAANILKTATQTSHAVTDHSAVSLDLRFARTTQKSETAPLPFQVGPTANQPALMIIQMSKFDLQSPLGGGRSFAKNF